MNAKDAIRMSIDMGQMIATGYLEDLTDEEMMHRPHPGLQSHQVAGGAPDLL